MNYIARLNRCGRQGVHLLLPVLALVMTRGLGAAEAVTGSPAQVSRSAPVTPDMLNPLRLDAAGEASVTFTLATDSLKRFPCPVQPDYSVLALDQGINICPPGDPDIPQRRVVIGIPPTGTISVTAVPDQEEVINDIRVAPVPTWRGERPDWVYSATFDADAFYPEAPVRVERYGWLRGVRVAHLLVSPVRYNPRREECRITRRMQVRVRFSEPARAQSTPNRTWARIYEDLLPNGNLAGTWARAGDTSGVRNFFDRSDVWYKVRVESTGVYRIGYDDLARAGASPDLIDPRTFQLYTLGAYEDEETPDTMCEVPLLLQTKSDSIFDPGDYFVFYARSSSHWNDDYTAFQRNLYTLYEYFWLTWGAASGARIAPVVRPPVPGATQLREASFRIQREEDLFCPGRAGLLWIWQEMTKSDGQDSASMDFNLGLDQPVALEALRIQFYSLDEYSGSGGSKTNRVHLHLNGQFFDSTRFTVHGAGNPYRFELLNLNLPVFGNSARLRVALVGDSLRRIFVDNFDVSYRRRLSLETGELQFILGPAANPEVVIDGVSGTPLVFDVTLPTRPRLVTGFEHRGDSLRFAPAAAESAVYCAVTTAGLRRPDTLLRRTPGHLKRDLLPVDYLIVAPDPVYDVAQLLQHYRTNNVPGIPNARVTAVRVSEVYDEFSFGREEPAAFRTLLRVRKPAYALFIGDATYDYRDTVRLRHSLAVPPYEIGADLDPNVYSNNAYSIDAWYADFEDGGATPDVILGRLTTRTPEEFRRYFDKLTAYEQGRFGFWNRRLLLLADDEWLGLEDDNHRDPLGGTHIPACEDMAGMAGTRLDPVKVYLTDYPLTEPNDKPGARAELFRQLANGALVWFFFGHGAGFQLNHEKTLHIDHVPRLQNGSRMPFAYFGSCGVGRWDDTRNEAVGEELTRKEDGTIASVAATKGTTPGSNEAFASRMFASILGRDSTIGRAFYAGWFGGDKLYHLFGEPALVLKLPALDTTLTVSPETLRVGQSAGFHASLPPQQGQYVVTGFTDVRSRRYQSPGLSITYNLPGYEFHRGLGTIADGALDGTVRVPNEVMGTASIYRGTSTPIPNTSRLSVLGWDAGRCYSAVCSGLFLDTVRTGGNLDHTGPAITVYADGKRLFDNDMLPAVFELSARVTDSAGILLAPVYQERLPLHFYVNDPNGTPGRVDVADRFVYDFGSSISGRFTISETLPAELLDTICVVATDNFLNRSTAKVAVRTRVDEQVRLENPLVYPNPAAGPADFTFALNRAARVTVRIHTISGRLVRSLPAADCDLGFNRVTWDGTDGRGSPLPDGVYLYQLRAEVAAINDGSRRSSSHLLNDKFIVRK